MPSSTSLMPSFCPASTVETLIFLRCRQMRPQAVTGALHRQRFVRPFGIELVHKSIEAGLLLQTVHARRAGSFLLEGEMQALMPTVLLRTTGFDAFDCDAQTQPPLRELGEVKKGIRAGEGDTVVGADGER